MVKLLFAFSVQLFVRFYHAKLSAAREPNAGSH
jgi:hypothetical protein